MSQVHREFKVERVYMQNCMANRETQRMELSCAGIVLAFCILINSVHTHIKVCIHILCMWYIHKCAHVQRTGQGIECLHYPSLSLALALVSIQVLFELKAGHFCWLADLPVSLLRLPVSTLHCWDDRQSKPWVELGPSPNKLYFQKVCPSSRASIS